MVIGLLLLAQANLGIAQDLSCVSAVGQIVTEYGPVGTQGNGTVETEIQVDAGHLYLVQMRLAGNDARLEILTSEGQLLALSDHPERRTGSRWAIVSVPSAALLRVRAIGKEHAKVVGSATITVFDLAGVRDRKTCLSGFRAFARGDAAYAAAEQSSSGRSTSTLGARASFLDSAREFAIAERSFADQGDQRLRGEAALAISGVAYFNLQNWQEAADWARRASEILTPIDRYRAARANALLAAAQIELGPALVSTLAHKQGAPEGAPATPNSIRRLLEQLVAFHLRRGERYDAGLQLTNIGLTYFNEGRFSECVVTSVDASRLFRTIGESVRQAVAEQNLGLCLWGLGQLPRAVHWLHHAQAAIDPENYPGLFLGATTNTALAEYSLGHYDQSLHLLDRALEYASQMDEPREVGHCLYGMGVNYYALGDRQRAQDYLERSLAIRTVAVDRRGRTATLRALATIDAEQGHVQQALAADSEALSLAVAPATVARIRIQQAGHLASAGRALDGLQLIDEVLTGRGVTNPVIRAEALLERAALFRGQGRNSEALADLEIAQPILHTYGTMMEEFDSWLERARNLRENGRSDTALVAIEKALSLGDAVRLQTANPELRAQLQAPLRPAVDLKLELLRDRYLAAVVGGRKGEAETIATKAFTTADSSRARSLADTASERFPTAVREQLARELRQRELLYRDLASRRAALQARVDKSGVDDALVKQLVADVSELRRRADAVNGAIAEQSMPRGNIVNIIAAPNIPFQDSRRTALVSYWLGARTAYAWVIFSGKTQWFDLGPTSEIDSQAQAVYHSMSRLVDVSLEQRIRDAEALYGLILEPLEASLEYSQAWIIVPDGSLDRVPFAALRSKRTFAYVAQTHDVAVAPAVWMLRGAESRESSARRSLLLVADPVYEASDPRLRELKVVAKGAVPGTQPDHPFIAAELQSLPYTGLEAERVRGQFRSDNVVALLGLDATRDRLLALDWTQFRFIHIATHAVSDTQVPSLSALVLGSFDTHGAAVEREVRVADIALKTLTAEVVAVSGCETALGAEVPSEGLGGIGAMLLARGAHSVVASLWPISDEVSARIMFEFYRNMLSYKMGPQTALGAAMRSIALKDRSQDPALWAAFQLSLGAVDGQIDGGAKSAGGPTEFKR